MFSSENPGLRKNQEKPTKTDTKGKKDKDRCSKVRRQQLFQNSPPPKKFAMRIEQRENTLKIRPHPWRSHGSDEFSFFNFRWFLEVPAVKIFQGNLPIKKEAFSSSNFTSRRRVIESTKTRPGV